MRKLMWFTIGFAAACVIGAYWLWGNLLFVLGGSLLAAAGAGLFLLRSSKLWRRGAVLLIGMAVGFCIYQLYEGVYLAPVRTIDGQTVELAICAKDFGYETSYGMAVDGTTELFGKQYQVKVYVHEETKLVPGTIVKGSFRLRFTGSGGIQEPTYHRGEGVFLLAYPRGNVAITVAESRSWQYGAVYLREAVLDRIGTLFPEDVKPFVQALLLGDTTALDYATDTALKLSGIRHVVAVSGLHVSILFAAIYWVTGKRRFWTVFLGIPVLLLFAAVAGFSPSIMRACTMQILMLLALLFKREYDPPTALAFAVLLMLAGNPQTITSVGFQLSVASVAGIFLFSEKIRGWLMAPQRWGKTKGKSLLGRGLRAAAASISVSVGAMITTTPLCAWYFGTVSLVGVAVNLLCLPVVTCLFCGIIVCCILGAVWIPAGVVAGWLLALPARYILWVAKVAAGFPLAAVYTQSLYVCLWLVFCYVLLAVFMLCRQRKPLALLCCATLGLCFALLASWTEPALDDYRVTALDVGQGQCILLQSQGKTYMVDCGGDRDEATADTVAAFLLSQGVFRLDGMILTHYDQDHVGAAEYVMSRIPTDQVILPAADGWELWQEQLTQGNNAVAVPAEEDVEISWGSAVITVYTSNQLSDSNESSLCVLFQTEKCAILITGDRSTMGELQLLLDKDIPELDALVVGHHGAATSTSQILLEKTKPNVALISVGEGNRYGHPSQTVIDRLVTYGCHIRRTDLEGTIILRG